MNKMSSKRPSLKFLVLTIVFSLLSTSASAALFLNFDGVVGDSQDSQHKDWINILTINWNIGVSRTTDVGGVSQPIFSDISWTQEQDSSFPSLFSHISNGTIMKSAGIDFTTPNDKGGRIYFRLDFEDVQLTNLSLSADGIAQPLISGAFAYDKVSVTYLPQDETGKELPPLSFEYDIATNSGDAANVANLFAQALTGPVASPVPVPAGVWLFAPAVFGLLARRRF